MTTDKTVKQIADELGTTKQTVQYHVKKLPKVCWYFDTKNGGKTIMIKPEGQEYIYAKLSKKSCDEYIDFATKTEYIELRHQMEISELEKRNVMERLRFMEKQNQEQGERINTLLQLLNQSQQLQAVAEQKIKQLEQKEHERQDMEVETKEQNQSPTEEVKKETFWYRLWHK